MKKLDKKIKKMVQSVRLDVPANMEDKFMDELNQLNLDESVQKIKHRRIWPVIATAASVILAVVIFVFLYLIKTPVNKKSDRDLIQLSDLIRFQKSRIEIRSVRINNKPAKTFYFQSKEKNKVIVWIQKNI